MTSIAYYKTEIELFAIPEMFMREVIISSEIFKLVFNNKSMLSMGFHSKGSMFLISFTAGSHCSVFVLSKCTV
jgi:hypothetical protein